MTRVARAIAPWLVSLAIFVGTGELLARLLHIVDRMNGYPRRLYTTTDWPDVPYRLRPGVDVELLGVAVHVNQLGLRGPETTPTPAPGVRRVLGVGDSSTFGQAVTVDDAWPAALQRALAERTAARWEVLNAGVSGWNTVTELGFLRAAGLALQPETVVVVFNLNDYDDTPTIGAHGLLVNGTPEHDPAWSPASWSELWVAVRWLLRNPAQAFPTAATRADTEQRFRALDQALSGARKRWYAHPDDPRWPRLVQAVHALGDLARKGTPRIVVLIQPDGDQFGDAPELSPQQRLLPLCAESGLDCVDLWPAFRDRGGAALFQDIQHPDAAGYRVVADMAATRLLAR